MRRALVLALVLTACSEQEASSEIAAPRGAPLAGETSVRAAPLETTEPRLSPSERLAREGFEALRMNDAERAAIAAALAASGHKRVPLECFPERVRAFDGASAVLRGWMIPGRMEKRAVREFMLVRDNAACCFGAMPTFDEWIHVEMEPGHEAKYLKQVCVEVTGTLALGGPELVEGIDPPALRMRATRCRFVESPRRP
ncbi:MAG: DUF3299 domain-containing protein [Planctomycetes bacterium]|nr:DUF3299 domain-containing protein [Planctomycetota bacterium]